MHENDNHPLTYDTYDWEDALPRIEKENGAVEHVLTAIWRYSNDNPDLSFGQIVQQVCGLARPAGVSNEFFIQWLKPPFATHEGDKNGEEVDTKAAN